MDSPKFDDLKALLSKFVKENPSAKIHFRESPHRDGYFRIFFQVVDPDKEESWEKNELVTEEHLESILGAQVSIVVGNEGQLNDYRKMSGGVWVSFIDNDLTPLTFYPCIVSA